MAPPLAKLWTTDPTFIDLLNYLIEIAKDAKSPISIFKSAGDFKEKSGSSQTVPCLDKRIRKMRTIVHCFEHIDRKEKVHLLFALSASVDANFLKQLKEEALVEVDDKKRIIHYKANDGCLELRSDHSPSTKMKTAKFETKGTHHSTIKNYFENKTNVDAVPETEEEKEMWNFIDFITEKCDTVNSPLPIRQLVKDFNKHFGITRSLRCIVKRVRAYCREIQTSEFLDTSIEVKQLFCLSAKLDSEYLEKLREDAVVEVDDMNRITKYTANNGRLSLHGDHSSLAKRELNRIALMKKKTAVERNGHSVGDKDKKGANEKECSEDDSDEYSSEEFDNDIDSNNDNNHLDETEDPMEPSNETDDFHNDTSVRNLSPTDMPVDDNSDFDPPTERSHRSEESEVRKDEDNSSGITENAAVKSFSIATLPKSNTSSSTSHTPKTPKRKAEASGFSSSKRTKPPSDISMNSGEMDDSISHDDPSRVELKPFRGILGLSNGMEDDPDIQQIPKPRPQVIEKPIKKEYEEEAHTSLKMILNAFKSLILSLDTPGLSQFQMEIDKRIMEAGRRSEVSNKEVILAMDFLIVKLSKHGSPEYSGDSISLRDILLMLRTIILNSNFNGLEVILETLKETIEQLKVLDKKVPVSKVECVLRATIDNIST